MKEVLQIPGSPFSVSHRIIQTEWDTQSPIALKCVLKMQAERLQDEKYKVGRAGLYISVYLPLVVMRHYGDVMEIHGGERCMEGETHNSGGH